jgi:hypothetical protein
MKLFEALMFTMPPASRGVAGIRSRRIAEYLLSAVA